MGVGLNVVVRERKEEVNKAAGWGVVAPGPNQGPHSLTGLPFGVNHDPYVTTNGKEKGGGDTPQRLLFKDIKI